MLRLVEVLSWIARGELEVVKAPGIDRAIDTTIIHLLLLPATMQSMGEWNWWPTRRNKDQSAAD